MIQQLGELGWYCYTTSEVSSLKCTYCIYRWPSVVINYLNMADEKPGTKTGTTSLAPSEKGSPPDSTIAAVDFAIGTTDTIKHPEKYSIKEKSGQDDYHKPAREEEHEVFGAEGEGQVNFRTVGWIRASMFLMKQTFATGVLSMPSAMYYLGGVMSPLFIVFWGLVNTYSAIIQGHFKLAHPKMHTIIDGAEIAVLDLSGSRLWSKVAKFIAEVLYLMSWLLCIGLAVLAIGTALNAVTKHGACTVACKSEHPTPCTLNKSAY